MKAKEITLKYSRNKGEILITSPEKAVDVLRPYYKGSIDLTESFYLMLLDKNNNVLGVHFLSKGGITATIADIRIICATALITKSTGVILSHNHPSGNLRPSEEDKKLTNRIKDALKLFEISVLDHLILTSESYFSFADEGIL